MPEFPKPIRAALGAGQAEEFWRQGTDG